MRVAEFFAGCGGLRIGLEGFGTRQHSSSGEFTVVYSNQYEPSSRKQHASEVYVARFGSQGHSNEDIFKVISDPEKFAQILAAKPDMLAAGFPCQDYSVAMSADKAAGIEGKKGVLWWSIHSCLSQLADAGHPVKYLLLENVDRLLKSPTKCRGRDLAIILASLASLGYAMEWRVVNSAEYGFAQRRKRVFLTGYHRSTQAYAAITRQCKAGDAAGWLTSNGVLANALPVDPNSAGRFATFAVGDDVLRVQEDFQALLGGASPFENVGVMLDGKVFTLRANAAAITDFTRFTGSAAAMTLGEVVASTTTVPESFYLSEESLTRWTHLKGSKSAERVSADGYTYRYSEGPVTYPDDLGRASRTIITGEGGSAPSRFKHVVRMPDGRLRRLVPEELEELTGFPRGHTELAGVSDVKRAFLMGNALIVGVVAAIGRSLAASIALSKSED